VTGAFHVEAAGDSDVAITRDFSAPRELVFDAHVWPELVKRWLAARGWTFPVCRIDARPGGEYRYEWKREGGDERMGVSGRFLELDPAARIAATEQFDEPWYPGTAIVTTTFADAPGGTALTMMARYESRAARDGVLAGPMAKGVEAGYAKLARLLEEMQGEFR